MENNSLSINDIENYIIYWNNRFKRDYEYRKKYNIPFNSPQHQATNQIDVFLDLYEDYLLKKNYDEYLNKQKALEDYKKTDIFLNDGGDSFEEDIENFLSNMQGKTIINNSNEY